MVAIVVISMCFICLKLLILQMFWLRVFSEEIGDFGCSSHTVEGGYRN